MSSGSSVPKILKVPSPCAVLAMGVPVVAIFGGTDPAKHSPLRLPHELLCAAPEPYPKDVSLGEAEMYMRAVSPENVFDACLRAVAPVRSSPAGTEG